MFPFSLLSFLVILMSGGVDCTKTATDLYNAEKQFTEVRYCSCLGRSDFKKFKSKTQDVLEDADKCPGLEIRSDSLRAGLQRYLSHLR